MIVLFVLVSFLVGHKSIEKINISADTDTEYHVGDSIPIEAKVTPSDAKLDDFLKTNYPEALSKKMAIKSHLHHPRAVHSNYMLDPMV